MDEFEYRSVPFEMRATGDGRTLEGYAAVFNSPARIFERGQEFDEQIAPGAFQRSLNDANKSKVLLQFDHGQHNLIGTMPIGKITDLREDSHGLYVEARLSGHLLGDIVRTAIEDEAITGMSFRFSVPKDGDTWDRSGPVPMRTLTNVHLYELGPVTTPAYDATSVGVRSFLRHLPDDRLDDLIREIATQRGLLKPEEGSADAPPVKPEEGSRFRTRSQRQALLALHSIRKDSDV